MKKSVLEKYAKPKEGFISICTAHAPSTPIEITEAFADFWEVLSEPFTGKSGQLTHGRNIDDVSWNAYNKHRQTTLTFEQVEAISKLLTDLKRSYKKYGERRYNEGLKDGKNALIQLNNGSLSMEDFNMDLHCKNRHNP